MSANANGGATVNVNAIAIVGAGQAGGWAAQTLRKEGFTGRITLIGDERFHPYERPPLSKAVLSGEAGAESTLLFRHEAFEALQLDWRPATSVVAIDPARRQLQLSAGDPLAYDKLILCTGGRARRMDVPGAGLPGLHSLRNIDDARALGAALQPGRRIVVVGGGWIGLEVAATARKKGAEAVVIEAMDRLCERTVPPEISHYLLGLHARHGVQVVLGAGVAGFSRDAGGGVAVALQDGRRFIGDAAVIGIGLVPNDHLARDAGLACEGGIVVDAACRTSDPDILAAGDVAAWYCEWAGRRMRLESWQNAQEQGKAAARSALGHPVVHQPLPWFWSDQYHCNLQIYGIPAPSDEVVLRGDPATDSFMLFHLDGHRITAAIGPNVARELKFARRLIESRKPVTRTQLSDTSTPLSRL